MAVGAWGDAGDVILCLLPLVLLVVLTLWGKGVPAHKSLPVAAMAMWLVRVAYLGTPTEVVSGSVVLGFLEVFTPLTIIMGAMFLFETMEVTNCLSWFSNMLKELSNGHPVAQIMLISWAFEYVVEGASGFGTPVALASPILSSLGHDPVNSVVVGLITNTAATIFGAAGTPIWFGFGGLLPEDELVTVGFRGQLLNGICSLFIPILALRFLVSWKNIFRNALFIYLSILSCVAPAIAFSYFSSEFPSLIGGLIGLLVTGVLVRFRVGLREMVPDPPADPEKTGGMLSCLPCCGPKRRSAGDDVEAEGKEEEVLNEDEEEVEEALNDYDPTMAFEANGEHEKILLKSEGDVDASFKSGLKSSGTVKRTPNSFVGVLTGSHLSQSTIAVSQIVLAQDPNAQVDPTMIRTEPQWAQVLSRTWCIWSSVLILVLTRVPQIGIKDVLTKLEPAFTINFNTFGIFKLSASIVFQFYEIMRNDFISWKYEFLYVPAYIPFILVSLISLGYFHLVTREIKFWPSLKAITATVLGRLKTPSVALTFALILVQLIKTDDGTETSPSFIIGIVLANAFQMGWIAISFLIGALGSFFSGSTTVSNLTFGGVQQIAAQQLQVSEQSMLAMQAVGATAGNMVCLNNIVNAKAVMNLQNPEADFIKKTGPVFFVYYVLATAIGGVLFFVIIK